MSDKSEKKPGILARTIDGAINIIAPQWSERRTDARARMELKASGSLASEKNNNNAPVDSEDHPDNDLIPDTPAQRRRCTLAYYNNPVVTGIVNSQVRRIIGTLNVQCDSGVKDADDLIEREWKTLLGGGLHEKIERSVRHMLIDGGCSPIRLGRITDPFKMDIAPYRLIKNPTDKPVPPAVTADAPEQNTIRDGFEFDQDNNEVAIHVEVEKSIWNTIYRTGQSRRIPLFSHLVLPRLTGQTKGLSWYSSSITRLDMVNRWMLALLTSAELHAYVVALCTSPGKDPRGMSLSQESTVDPTTQQRIMKFAREHRVLFIPNGGDWKLIQANAPQLGDFVVSNFRVIARQLGVSYERLMCDLTHTSFSSAKFGDRDDRLTVGDQQDSVIRKLLSQCHYAIIQSLLYRNLLSLPGAGRFAADPFSFQQVRFTLPGTPPVDEVKAETANTTALENRTASRTRIAANRGDDAREIVDEINREDSYYFDERRALWKSKGYDDETARDMARDEVQMRGAVATRITEDASGAGEGEGDKQTEQDQEKADKKEKAAA